MSDDLGPSVLLQVRAKKGAPDLAECARLLGMPVAKLDADFGVVEIDADHGDYAVRAAMRDVPKDLHPRHGPFSDPQIAPFGPLQ